MTAAHSWSGGPRASPPARWRISSSPPDPGNAPLVDGIDIPGDWPEDWDIPEDWAAAAREIVRRGARRVMVLGATDTGKTTLCRVLSSRLADAGIGAALVDADTGQKWAGPPATVTLLHPPGHVAAFHFVGSTDPVRHFVPLVTGTARLCVHARTHAGTVLVNTGGLIGGPGFALKGYKIEAVRPDLILALQRGGELEPLLDAHRHVPAIRLAPSPRARRRKAAERRAARRTGFAQAFAGAVALAPDAATLAFQRQRPPGDPPEGTALLCTACDRSGEPLGLALLDRLAPLLLRTSVPAADIAVLQFGTLLLGPAFEEHGDTRHLLPRNA